MCRLRDWGTTDYNIVCNWTPHNNKLASGGSAPKSSSNPEASVTKLFPHRELCSATRKAKPLQSTSYRLKRSNRKQQSFAESQSSWYVPDDPISTVKKQRATCKQNSRQRGGLPSNNLNRGGQIDSSGHSSDVFSLESPDGTASDNSDSDKFPSPNSDDVHIRISNQPTSEDMSYCKSMNKGEEQSAPIQRPDNEDMVVEDGRDVNSLTDDEGMDVSVQPLSSKKPRGSI